MSAVCTKTYQIVVADSGPTADYSWWKFEESSDSPRVDSVRSLNLAVAPSGDGQCASEPALIDDGMLLYGLGAEGSVFVGRAVSPLLAPGATGATYCGWFRVNALASAGSVVDIAWVGYTGEDFTAMMDLVLRLSVSQAFCYVAGGANTQVLFDGGAFPPLGEWVFFAMVFDVVAGQVKVYTGLSGTLTGPFTVAQASTCEEAYVQISIVLNPGAGTPSLTFDEFGWFNAALSLSQLEYLYHAGAGRTSPIVFP